MTATAAKWGFGTTLTRDGNTIAQLSDIGGISLTQEVIDVTNYASADEYREKIGGLLDAGTVPIRGEFKPDDTAGQIGLKTDMEAHTIQTFVLTLPSAFATTLTFTALVTKLTIEPPMAGVVAFSAELTITGAPTLGITASNNITALTVTTATCFPTFAQATYSYVLDSAATTSVTFNATFAAGTCVLKEDGVVTQTLTSTEESAAVTSSTTPKTVRLEVTQSGKTTTAYEFLLAKTE
jgi:predicted secreted protein